MTPVVFVRHSPGPDIYMRCPSTYQLISIYCHVQTPVKDVKIKSDMGTWSLTYNMSTTTSMMRIQSSPSADYIYEFGYEYDYEKRSAVPM